jgi:VWFA-related protein
MKQRTLVALSLVGLLGAPAAPPTAAQQPPPEQQKPPVFRAGTTLVQVDAYPSRDGRIVEGLTKADFEVLEDGKAQAIEDLQFIRVEPNTPVAERLDPNTQEEGNRLAADPRNRVFVVYLDHYHVNIDGSFRTRRPLVDALNRLLTASDLFGVMTPLLRPRDLILARKTQMLEEQLAKYWTWGEKPSGDQRLFMKEPEEQALWQCFPPVVAGEAYMAEELVRRRRQDRVIQSLHDLVAYLGTLREARKVLLLFSSGWQMYRPGPPIVNTRSRPGVGVDPAGRLTTKPPPGSADLARCDMEAARLSSIDTQDDIRRLLESANRNNVSFYPVNPAGLEAPDAAAADPGAPTTSPRMREQFDDIRDRWQLLLTLADNTDGIAVGSNDMAADLRRITDDVSAYYVLSYYSTNQAQDGRYRRIEVKVRGDGVSVKARRGYVAPDAEALERTRTAAGSAPKTPAAVDEALAALTRLRPSAEVYVDASARPGELTVVVELPADRGFSGRWAKGALVEIAVTDAAGTELGSSSARIDPPSRGQLARIALPDGSRGPWVVSTRLRDGATPVVDTLEVAPPDGTLVGDAVLFRARTPASAPLQPAAEPLFARTERLHLDWPLLGTIDRREARVLGRDGAPLPIPLTVTEREVEGRAMLSLDLRLAPLTEAAYLIELTVGQAETTERKLVAFRVIR